MADCAYSKAVTKAFEPQEKRGTYLSYVRLRSRPARPRIGRAALTEPEVWCVGGYLPAPAHAMSCGDVPLVLDSPSGPREAPYLSS